MAQYEMYNDIYAQLNHEHIDTSVNKLHIGGGRGNLLDDAVDIALGAVADVYLYNALFPRKDTETTPSNTKQDKDKTGQGDDESDLYVAIEEENESYQNGKEIDILDDRAMPRLNKMGHGDDIPSPINAQPPSDNTNGDTSSEGRNIEDDTSSESGDGIYVSNGEAITRYDRCSHRPGEHTLLPINAQPPPSDNDKVAESRTGNHDNQDGGCELYVNIDVAHGSAEQSPNKEDNPLLLNGFDPLLGEVGVIGAQEADLPAKKFIRAIYQLKSHLV